MGLSARRERLLGADRWRALGAFVDRWYARPLADEDGVATEEIERAAARLGAPLPAALAEWYELVGRRLCSVQDAPSLPEELAVEDGAVSIWTENQGVWSIRAPVGAGDDPVCRLDDASFAWPGAAVSDALLGMLASDTLVGAWGGSHAGTLGDLGARVRGGYCEDFTAAHVQGVTAAYPALSHVRNPFFAEPYRGDATTIVRIDEVWIQWMTATDEAYAALDHVLDLTPAGGEHEVVVELAPAAERHLGPLVEQRQGYCLPDLKRFTAILAGAGRATQGSSGDRLRVHIETREPRLVLERLLAELPGEVRPHLTIATHPVAVSVFEVLYPPNRSTFVL